MEYIDSFMQILRQYAENYAERRSIAAEMEEMRDRAARMEDRLNKLSTELLEIREREKEAFAFAESNGIDCERLKSEIFKKIMCDDKKDN